MCFAPQRRALFRHLNVEKCSVARQFFTLLTSKCASRHKACTFSTSQLLKVVRSCCVLYILTSKCASRHNDVHFFDIATSKSAPKLRCFIHFDLEMCFAPQRRAIFHLSSGQLAPWTLRSHKSLEKQCFATFLPFRAPGSSFFWDFLFLLLLSSLTLPISAFHLSISSEVWLLNFLR